MNVGEREVTAGAVAHDLESNSAISIEVSRRIVDKQGNRFADDLVILTSNAAMSIAFRNAVLRIIPKAFWDQIYDRAQKCIANGKESIAQRRAKALEWLMARGIPSDAILRRLDRGKIGEITGEDLVTLRGIINAAREDNVDLREEFEVAAPTAKATAAPLPVAQPRTEAPPPRAEPIPGGGPPAVKRPVGRPPKQVVYADETARVDQAVQEAAAMMPPVQGPPVHEEPPMNKPPAGAPVPVAAPPAPSRQLDAKTELWLKSQGMRNRLSAAELKVVRQAAEVQYINTVLPLEQLAACVARGMEILEERDGSMIPEEGA